MKAIAAIQLLLIICLLITIIAASSDDGSDEIDGSFDAVSTAETSQELNVNGLNEYFNEEGFCVENPLPLEQQHFLQHTGQLIIENNFPVEENPTSRLEKIDFIEKDQSHNNISDFVSDIWNDLLQFLYENSENEPNREIVFKLKGILVQCLKQPDKVGLYPNEHLQDNLSFAIQQVKLVILALIAEHNQLIQLINTKEADYLLTIAEVCLWKLSFLICIMHTIEGSKDLHILFDRENKTVVGETLYMVLRRIQEENNTQKKDSDPLITIINKIVEYGSEGTSFDERLNELITITSYQDSVESITLAVETLHADFSAKKTISRDKN